MRVLVTGGAGFIGSHTVDLLLNQGVSVRVLDNFSSGKKENLSEHPDLEVVVGDILDVETVNTALVGVTHVLHLAAQVSVTLSAQLPIHSSAINVTGFLHVLEGARKQGIERFVYASSAAVYGIPTNVPVNELTPVAPISVYGLEKSINDQYSALYRELYGFTSLGLRYFNVYGPRQDPKSPYSGVVSIFTQRALDDQKIIINGDGLQTRDFIYVGDIARANVAALLGNTQGICNVACGISVTLLDLVNSLAEIKGSTPLIEHAESRVGDIRHSASENAKLQRELGIDHFISLNDGLRMLIDYCLIQ